MIHGKKLYKSKSFGVVKIIATLIIVGLFINLWVQTLNNDTFSLHADKYNHSVLKFHITYPEEILSYLFFIFIPCFYYGFIRGIIFFEKGVIINKGFPFFNSFIPYENIASYQVISDRYLISIKHKSSGDDSLFVVNDIDRAVALMDQSNIKGDLGGSIRSDIHARKKLTVFYILVGIVVGIIQFYPELRGLIR